MDALDLQSEIDKMRKQIKTDNYLMSIGEIANLYRDGDLNISPIYQRLFRWDIFHLVLHHVLVNLHVMVNHHKLHQ